MKNFEGILTIIVPVYNEAQILPEVAPEIVDLCEKKQWQVIFVNDGSRDRSREILAGFAGFANVQIIHHKVNKGYGGAIKSGIRAVTTPFLVTIDADGQHNLEDVAVLLNFALEQDADMVVGNRGQSGDINPYRAIGKRIIRLFTRMLMPLPVRDLNSGFKLYRTELAQRYIAVCPNSMAFSDVITLIFANQRNLVLEHPITVVPRKVGKSTISAYTAFETILEILNIVLMFDPLRIFMPFAIFCISIGLIWGTIILFVVGRGVSVGAMLAIVTGLIFFILGLLANQISAMRMENLQKDS
ncbi:MAG: glycosyltransferase family 2 protein [Chloroflexota bacterium]